MHHDRSDEEAIRDRQARFAERLSAEAGSDSATRIILLDGAEIGRVEYDSESQAWEVLYANGTRSGNRLLGEADHVEQADRHGIGTIADALGRGVIAAPGQSTGGR